MGNQAHSSSCGRRRPCFSRLSTKSPHSISLLNINIPGRDSRRRRRGTRRANSAPMTFYLKHKLLIINTEGTLAGAFWAGKEERGI
jgi:hypothetical protein